MLGSGSAAMDLPRALNERVDQLAATLLERFARTATAVRSVRELEAPAEFDTRAGVTSGANDHLADLQQAKRPMRPVSESSSLDGS